MNLLAAVADAAVFLVVVVFVAYFCLVAGLVTRLLGASLLGAATAGAAGAAVILTTAHYLTGV